jgi:hypothetical protein
MRSGILLFVIAAAAAWAQGTASLTGIVSDSQGAVIPAATVKVRHVDTNSVRELATDGEGSFTITNLAPGTHELQIEKEGFRPHRVTDMTLEVGQVLRQDVHLQVGAVADSVSVTAEATLINTESGAIKGDVITNQQINEIPLDGRDFFDLALMVPGVVPMAQGGQGSGLNVNGSRSDSTNYSVDGFNNRNPRGAGTYVRPNMSAMQEFKMEVSGFSAENGRMAGGVMNMVLRSGTNQYHGDVFEYIRNNIFDARSFFDEKKLSLRRNQFGATLHGPLTIPKIYNGKDRTFFLFSWEAYREVLGQSFIGNVPTVAQRAGDFSASVVPVTGAKLYLKDPLLTPACNATNAAGCFPDNRIPASRFDPIALRLMQFYPLPNRADPNNNFINTVKDFDTWASYMGKVDHRFGPNDTMAFRIQQRVADNTNPTAGSALAQWPTYVNDPRYLVGLDYTHMFSPTLIMEVRGGVSRNATEERAKFQGQDIAEQLGITGTTKDPFLVGFPRFTIQDYLPIGSASAQPVSYHVTMFQLSNKFTWIRGKHAMKFGWDIERTRFNQPFNDNSRGTFNFQRNWTQHSVADFLLGLMQSTTRTLVPTRNYLRSLSLGSFFADDFKVTRSFTLNLGMRYELDMPPVDAYDRMSNFVPGINKIVVADSKNVPDFDERIARFNLQDRVVLAKDAGLPRSLVIADKVNFAPRLGFAWRLPYFKRTTVVRGGYGIFFTGHLLNPIRTSLMTGFPFSVNQTFSRLASDVSLVSLANPFPDIRATEGNSTNSNGYELRPKMGDLQSWNFTIERELATGWALEMGYVGSKGTHLGRQYDINQPYRSLEAYQANTGFPRPIAGVNTINYYGFGSNSNYHAGQISLRRQMRGAFVRFNYSLSKSIDDASQLSGASAGGFAGAQSARDLRSERGRSDFDRRHVITAVYSTPLPFGRGRKFFGTAKGLAQGVIGGWQMSGSASFLTGQALTVQSANVDANLGESLRPNRIGSGVQEDIPGAGKRGVDYPWFKLSDFEPVPRCASRSVCETSAYGFTPFNFGNSGRNILDGPSAHYINMAMLKNFPLRERRRVQVRYELFNILNHANLNLPDRAFNALGGGMVTAVVDRGRGGPRVMQLALKFEF